MVTEQADKTNTTFQQMLLGQLEIHKRMKLDPYFILYTKITQNGPKNIRAKTIKLVDANTGTNHELDMGNGFLDMKAKAQGTKEKH